MLKPFRVPARAALSELVRLKTLDAAQAQHILWRSKWLLQPVLTHVQWELGLPDWQSLRDGARDNLWASALQVHLTSRLVASNLAIDTASYRARLPYRYDLIPDHHVLFSALAESQHVGAKASSCDELPWASSVLSYASSAVGVYLAFLDVAGDLPPEAMPYLSAHFQWSDRALRDYAAWLANSSTG